MTKSGKKIAILCFSPNQGGMEMDSIRLYKKLGRMYDNVWLVCEDGTFMSEHAAHDEEISNWHAIKFRHSFSFSLIFGLRDFIRKNNINNVIFFGTSEMHSIYFALLGMNVNMIVRHGTTTAKRHKKKDLFHRLLYSKVSHFVGISKHLVNNIHEIFPINKKADVNLIYSTLKFPIVSKKTRKEKNGVVNIVHVGRLTTGKGQDVAIRACSVLYDNGIPFRLVLVGNGDVKYKEMLEKMLAPLPYKDSVIFLGHTDDVFSVLGASEVFLFPSAGEGFGNALIEALSCGLVCLVYSNTIFPEIFNMGFYGHVIEDGDEDQLRKTLLRVCQNLDKEMDMATNNTDLARRLFSEEREIAEYDKILV